VFAYEFDEIAGILGKTSTACRKLASRARTALQAERPRFETTPDEHRRLLDAFLKAAYAGELNQLKSLLAESAQLHSDGGGKAEAAAEVLVGAETIARFMVRVLHERLTAHDSTQIVPRWFNGAPGVLIYENGRLVTALSVAVEMGGIHRIFAVRNPDKLAVFSDRKIG
jgi:RNA polymerase sigma-70 factor (ECF subfamily)